MKSWNGLEGTPKIVSRKKLERIIPQKYLGMRYCIGKILILDAQKNPTIIYIYPRPRYNLGRRGVKVAYLEIPIGKKQVNSRHRRFLCLEVFRNKPSRNGTDVKI